MRPPQKTGENADQRHRVRVRVLASMRPPQKTGENGLNPAVSVMQTGKLQ